MSHCPWQNLTNSNIERTIIVPIIPLAFHCVRVVQKYHVHRKLVRNRTRISYTVRIRKQCQLKTDSNLYVATCRYVPKGVSGA